MKELISLNYPIICEHCKHGCSKLLSTLLRLEGRVDEIEKSQKPIEARVTAIEEGKGCSQASVSQSVDEMTRRERAKQNVLIHGLPATAARGSANDVICEILETCGMQRSHQNLVQTRWIGKATNRGSQPLLKKFPTLLEKIDFQKTWKNMVKEKKLPEKYDEVKIGDDLTKMQRMVLADLRHEANSKNEHVKDGKKYIVVDPRGTPFIKEISLRTRNVK